VELTRRAGRGGEQDEFKEQIKACLRTVATAARALLKVHERPIQQSFPSLSSSN